MTQQSLEYPLAKPIDEIGGVLRGKIDAYYTYLLTLGYNGAWARIYKTYYMGKSRDARLNAGGDQGEFTVGNVNHLHSILKRILVLTITQRPAFEPQATNSDVKSMKQTILARQLLNYYTRVKRAERDLQQAVEFALLFGEGFVYTEWDATVGDVLGFIHADTKEPLGDTDIISMDAKDIDKIHEGDIRVSSFEPIDVIRDVRQNNYRNRDWLILRDYQNKYNLAAKYPQFADEITKMSQLNASVKDHYRQKMLPDYDTDVIVIYTFLHAKTPALPNGRITTFLENGRVLVDGPLPYKHLPVYRVAAEERVGTPFGNTIAYDLMPLQEAYDMEFSTVLTNHNAFGTQNVMVPKGSGLTITQLEGGLNLVEYDHNIGKPEPLNLLNTPAEVFSFMTSIEQNMEMVSGVNSTVRGNPQAGLGKDASGAAMALVQSQAIEFNSPLGNSYAQLLEDFGTGLIQILQQYAKTKRILSIAGDSGRSNVIEFQSKDLESIERVVVNAGNPMAATVEGRTAIAKDLLQMQVIKTADEYLDIIETGNLDPMIQGKEAELMNIHAENEYMADGKPAQVLLTDEHVLHIQEHKSVLADPSARENPQIVQVALKHIQDHLNILMDPANAQMLQLLGQPSLAAPPPQGQAPGQGGPPQQAAPQQPHNPVGPGPQHPAAKQPGPPPAPINPLTHQPAPLAAGTFVKGH